LTADFSTKKTAMAFGGTAENMLAKLELSVTIWSYELFMPESGVACDVVLLTSKLVNKLYEW